MNGQYSPEVPWAIDPSDKEPAMTASLEALCEIILDDENKSLRSRMLAAEQLLSFEAPADAAELAKGFLTEVFEDDENHVGQRLEALKIILRAEARKITQPTNAANEAERREAWRKELMKWRRRKIRDAGIWPLPEGWDDDLKGPDFVPPDGEPPAFNPTTGLGKRFAEARQEFLKAKGAKPRES
jgi:hypothetical protein